uniref:Uncharacterized protein n=1 Tax=Rhizophora mucronata TaxID=61149 RepID=A0A2P2NLT7_RHIMU
MVSFPLLFLKC